MKEGDIVLVPLLQADGQRKHRPAVLLKITPPFGDLLVCGISSQLRQFMPGLDERILQDEPDFPRTGLKTSSLVRLAFLAVFTHAQAVGTIGELPPERLQVLTRRLGDYLAVRSPVLRRVVGLIPARYASTRFPGKPLQPIAGRPLIQHVVERCKLAKSLSQIIVATDDERIAEVARRFCQVEMTRADHPSGTDRIAEVVSRVDCDAAVNIQGDEPLMDPTVIDAVAAALADSEMSTAATPITDAAEYESPNVVKVVTGISGRALYFSRRTIPCLRDHAARPAAEQVAAFPFLKHLGIYGYRRETLLRLIQFPVSPLEQSERLEQLRALENGIAIAVVRVDYDSVGVDVPADVGRVEAVLRRAAGARPN